MLFSVIIMAFYLAVWWQKCIQVTSKFDPAEITPSLGIFGGVSAENSARVFFFLAELQRHMSALRLIEGKG